MYERSTADAIIEQTYAAADHQFAIFLGLPRKAEARSEVIQRRPGRHRETAVRHLNSGRRRGIVTRIIVGYHVSDHSGTRSGRASRRNRDGLKLRYGDVGEVSIFVRVGAVVFPTNAQ